jgi:hypothetical protein
VRRAITPDLLAAPGRTAVSWLCAVVFAGLALAHSPHLSPKADWTAPDGKRYGVAMLWGDGIIAADPGRPVVLDESGQVVALGPLVTDAFIHCRTRSDCIVILDQHYSGKDAAVAVAPDPLTFQPGRLPDFYPEYEKASYGFKPATLTLADQWVTWTVLFRRAPIFAVPWTLLWVWLGFKCGGILTAARHVGRHVPSFPPFRLLGFAVAWTGLALVAALVPLILVNLSLWLDGSLLNLRPVLAAFLAAFAVRLWRAFVGVTAEPSEDRAGTAAGTAT